MAAATPEVFLTLNSASGTATPTTNGSIKAKGIVVFSGGSAANNLVDVFKTVREDKRCPLSYVIPISDNGGSSSELIRVFGGPGIGDVRSRLVRLIPDDPDNDESEKAAIKAFFNHRLPKEQVSAKQEWLQIVEAQHPLWTNISTAKKELIRSILNHVAFEIVKRRRPSSTFDFSGASIGNLFLTGARLFTGSLESAIYLLSSICSVPSHTSVLPAINTNFSHHISVGLANGTIITGQNSISHPSTPSALDSLPPSSPTDELDAHDRIEDANLPGSLPSLRKQYITFSKAHEDDLPARIRRLWYINPYGQEIRLAANPTVLSALADAQAVIYSIGSLYTSIVPSLVLKGIGPALANPAIKYKILILNSTLDRETGPRSAPFSALDFVAAIADAAATSQHSPHSQHSHPHTDTVTHTTSQPTSTSHHHASPLHPSHYKNYITHIIHLTGPGTPAVDQPALRDLGIEAIRVYGRREAGDAFTRYDERALIQALEVTMGKGEMRGVSRRNTIVEGGR